MAKKKRVESLRPSKREQRRWQAEDIVRRQLTEGPAFEKEVRRVERELARIDSQLKVRIGQKR